MVNFWYNFYMNLCSDNHDEVCFEGRECPTCKIVKELGETIEELEGKLKESEETIETLKEEIQSSNVSNDDMIKEVEQLRKDLMLTRNGQIDGER